MAEVTLQAKKRDISTKGAVNSLRKEGYIPGVFYIKGNEAIPIAVQEGDLNHLVFSAENYLVQLKIEGDKEEMHESIFREVQFDPVTDKVVHFDLRGITRGEVVQLEVPLALKGTPIGVKEGGILQQALHKLEIECLPKNIPSQLEYDVTELKFGDTVVVEDLKFENIEILNSPKTTVISIVAPVTIKEPEAEEEGMLGEEEVEEPEVIKKGKAEDEEESEAESKE